MWLNKDLVEGFDLILDDGLHRYDANICFLENSIHKLNPGGIYIIEDINNDNLGNFNKKLDKIKKLHPDLQYDLVTLPSTVNKYDNRVLVIRKNPQIKILSVILSCLEHKHLWPTISERLHKDTIILCGGANETKLDGNILYLDCVDTYDGLSEKIMKAYEFILNSDQFTEYTHILKADDHDTYFELQQVKEIEINHRNILYTQDYIGQNLINMTHIPVLIQHFGRVPNNSSWYNKPITEPFVPFLGGGEIYILSKKSLNAIVLDKIEYKKYCGCEDIMIGNILSKHNINPCELNFKIKTWIG
jgi:SAM-dependent methyltransferase